MHRRSFLSALGAAALPVCAAVRSRIVKVETVWWPSRDDAPFWPHWTWVRLTTEDGASGTGETYPRNETEAAAIHNLARPLLGHPAGDLEAFWRETWHSLDFQIAGGAETRALSALDLALWDLLGKSLAQPVWQLLGGRTNPRVRLYNTCFPHRYDFHTDPDKIMRDLIDQHGIRTIKVWPFDPIARETRGNSITPQQLDRALTPIRKLRDQFGDSIDILVEFHSMWTVTAAARIAKALEPYHPMWLEDMLLPGEFRQYRELAQSTPLPLTAGERVAGKWQFHEMIEHQAVKYVMFDVCWCGGLTEARKITQMADAALLPFAPHTAGGPLLFYASTHLSTAMPNVAIQESCQRFYESDWKQMLEAPLYPKDGHISATDAPGFGMVIKEEAWNHPKSKHRVSTV